MKNAALFSSVIGGTEDGTEDDALLDAVSALQDRETGKDKQSIRDGTYIGYICRPENALRLTIATSFVSKYEAS